ncbi:hypothetical protein L596_029426 [Steinernema carpocapsae]|uniref:Uncharacterized protein n=1 Tax=Steinernema carpocapsae TaxID=34508 RepID=A0A4U5LUM1_STECR|nr:hypothetical protein L596_029426 [Steinernema carpocapsae]
MAVYKNSTCSELCNDLILEKLNQILGTNRKTLRDAFEKGFKGFVEVCGTKYLLAAVRPLTKIQIQEK